MKEAREKVYIIVIQQEKDICFHPKFLTQLCQTRNIPYQSKEKMFPRNIAYAQLEIILRYCILLKRGYFMSILQVPSLTLSSKNQRDFYDLGKTIWKLKFSFLSCPEEAKY